MKKIAITCREESSIWSNGLDQNIYFFTKFFRKMGYYVDLVSEVVNAKKLLDETILHLNIKNILDYDLIIEIAHPLSDELTHFFNSKGRALVALKLGNNFFIDIENMIHYGDNPSRLGTLSPFRNREIWVSPHFYKFKDYMETISRTEVKQCPYIWDSCILEMQSKKPSDFPSKESIKKIGIVEPNLNIIKTSITPLTICELAYNKENSLIDEIYCFNSKRFSDKKVFLDFVKLLNIHKNKISSYENRISMHQMFLNNLCGTIVSHQMFNELNYVYLEAIYYNRLLIHNSPDFSDAGYYYQDHDSEAGAEMLEYGIKNYYNNEKIEKSRKYLEKYSMNNIDNLNNFKKLIEGVLWK